MNTSNSVSIVCHLENYEEIKDFVYSVDPAAQFTVSGIITKGNILTPKLGDVLVVENGELILKKSKIDCIIDQ
jgi:hypothetical protein